MNVIAQRLDGITESATLKLNAAVQALKAKGVDVVNFTAGEPDFMVPEPAKEAILEAVKTNKSKYTAAAGIPELRQAVAEKTNRQQTGLDWKPENVVVTNGGKQALFNTFMALLDPSDEVLIPSPYWLSYPEMVKIMGAVPKFIEAPLSQGFKISPEQLERALASGPKAQNSVKMLILNSPSNPTGAMYSKAEYAALGAVLKRHERVWVVSDEIYDRITFTQEPFCSFLNACPELRERTVTVNGMSKSAAMTGWRIGWSVAPKVVTQALVTLQGQSTSNVNALAQWASVSALKLPESYFENNRIQYLRRRDLCLDILRKNGKIDLFTPGGAFYLFVGVKRALKSGEDSIGLAERILEQAQVAVVPGTPFGAAEFIRLSFASDERSLQEGCERLVKFFA
jgi:aspartate aminotransferase